MNADELKALAEPVLAEMGRVIYTNLPSEADEPDWDTWAHNQIAGALPDDLTTYGSF